MCGLNSRSLRDPCSSRRLRPRAKGEPVDPLGARLRHRRRHREHGLVHEGVVVAGNEDGALLRVRRSIEEREAVLRRLAPHPSVVLGDHAQDRSAQGVPGRLDEAAVTDAHGRKCDEPEDSTVLDLDPRELLELGGGPGRHHRREGPEGVAREDEALAVVTVEDRGNVFQSLEESMRRREHLAGAGDAFAAVQAIEGVGIRVRRRDDGQPAGLPGTDEVRVLARRSRVAVREDKLHRIPGLQLPPHNRGGTRSPSEIAYFIQCR